MCVELISDRSFMERLFVSFLTIRFNLKRKRKMVSEYIQKLEKKKQRPVVDAESLRWTPLVAKSIVMHFEDVSTDSDGYVIISTNEYTCTLIQCYINHRITITFPGASV